jgi:SAM-dependent methyltransferase
LRARFAERFAFELRPEFGFIRAATERALKNRLSTEDSEDKKAVVISGSLWLVRALGLAKTKVLVLDHPDFTLQNLALLSDEYDFVIADRALHRCDSLDDAGHEIMRVLRPGGYFVHTVCRFDFVSGQPVDLRRFALASLARAFPGSTSVSTGGGPIVGWVVGRKATGGAELDPTATTRVARRRRYAFKPRHARFGVTAIVRNEAPYLLQWIAHYRVLGFGQITIYDNESNDGSSSILGPLARAGVINAVYWRDRAKKQVRAYNNAIGRLRPFVEWCLFADLDEFLVLDPGLALEDILPADPKISAIGIPWRMFGSDGQRNRGTDLVIERFTKAAPTFHRLVKSLVRLRDTELMGIHIPRKAAGRVTDLAGLPLDLETPRTAPSAARLYHYFNRSWEEFVSKCLRGDIALVGKTYTSSDFDRYGAGEVEVRDAWELAPAIRQEVSRLRAIIGCKSGDG